jgi:hypothetical protein
MHACGMVCVQGGIVMLKLTRYSGKRHSRELFAWLRRCIFRREK